MPRNARVYNSIRVVNASPSGQSGPLQLKSSCKPLLCPERLAFLTRLELETAALPRNARVYNSGRVVNASLSGQSSRLQLKSSCKRPLCPEQLAFLTRLRLATAALPRNACVYNSSPVVNASPSGQSARLQLKSSWKRQLCPETLAFPIRGHLESGSPPADSSVCTSSGVINDRFA